MFLSHAERSLVFRINFFLFRNFIASVPVDLNSRSIRVDSR
jgi:hypothetical protein